MKCKELAKEIARLSGGKNGSVAIRKKLKGKYIEEYTEEELQKIDFAKLTDEDIDIEIVGVHVYNEDFSNALDNPYLKLQAAKKKKTD